MTFDLEKTIQECKQKKRYAQKLLYDVYKSMLFGICRRYMRNTQDAEDVFAEGFTKIFTNIESFKGEGSFEGWMKRIMINESLMHLRKNKKFKNHLEMEVVHIGINEYIDEKIDVQTIIKSMEELPPGYRSILNLYVVEGYKHREIAELLDISINTSKSQLILARKRMQKILKKNLDIDSSFWKKNETA